MNLKVLFLCFNAVAATSHNHLRHQSEQHEIVFRATKGQLRRLLKGDEKAPSKDLEALHVLRGGSQRFLKSCTYTNANNTPQTDKCDDDTEKCTDKGCKEVCDEKKDCSGHGECKNGKCKCDQGYEDKKDCSQRDVVYNFKVAITEPEESRSAECTANLKTLAEAKIEDIADDLPSTVSVDSKSKRSRNRRLSNKSEKGALVVDVVIQVDHTCEAAAAAVKAVEELEAAESKTLDVDEDDLPDSYECLLDESKELLEDAEDDKDADDLEGDLNSLVDTCNVEETVASCVTDCHDGMKKDCKDELDDEDDCKGLHNDLKKCYKKCYALS